MRIRKCACGCPPGLPLFRFPDINKPHTAARRKVWLRLLGVQETERILDENNKDDRIPQSDRLYACYRHFSNNMRSGRQLIRQSVPDRNIKGKIILPEHYGVARTHPVAPRGGIYRDYFTYTEISPLVFEAKSEISFQKRAPVDTNDHSYDAKRSSTEAENPAISVKYSAPKININNYKYKHNMSVKAKNLSTSKKIENTILTTVSRGTSPFFNPAEKAKVKNPPQPPASVKIEDTMLTTVSRSTSPFFYLGEKAKANNPPPPPPPSIKMENTIITTVSRGTSPYFFPAEEPPLKSSPVFDESSTITVDVNSFIPVAECSPIYLDENSLISLDENDTTTDTYPPDVQKLLCADQMPIEYDEKKMMAVVGRLVQTDGSLSANTPRKKKLKDDLKELKQRLKLLEAELKVKEEELKFKDNQLTINAYKYKMIENEVKIKDNALAIKTEELKMRDKENKKLVRNHLDYVSKIKKKRKEQKVDEFLLEENLS